MSECFSVFCVLTVLVGWWTTPVSLVLIKKDVLILMLLLFGFWAFDFEAIPQSGCYLTSIMNITHHRSVTAPFSVQLSQLF